MGILVWHHSILGCSTNVVPGGDTDFSIINWHEASISDLLNSSHLPVEQLYLAREVRGSLLDRPLVKFDGGRHNAAALLALFPDNP